MCLLVGSPSMEEDFTYAGILVAVQSDGMLLVALPEAAAARLLVRRRIAPAPRCST